MPTTRRGEALRQQRGEEEDNVTLSEEEESVVERGHADDTASAGSRSTQHPAAPQFTTEFLSTLIESVTRAQVEANRTLITSLMTVNSVFRASTLVGNSPITNTSSGGAAAAAASRAGANFTRCTARFDGASQDAFLDAVEIYKECAAACCWKVKRRYGGAVSKRRRQHGPTRSRISVRPTAWRSPRTEFYGRSSPRNN